MKNDKHLKTFEEHKSESNTAIVNNNSFTYEQVRKFIIDFNFEFAWVEPKEVEQWIKENIK